MTDTLAEETTATALEEPRREKVLPGPGKRPPARRRLASYLVVVLFVVTLNFFLPRAMPGDPLMDFGNQNSSSYVQDDATRTALAEYYGLDRPLLVQYGRYLGGLARGDLGVSTRYRAPVLDLVKERFPWTLLLLGAAMALATTMGLLAGVQSGWRRSGALDRGLLGFFLGLRNFPGFFLGSVALFFFAVKLGWFPLGGATTPFSGDFGVLRRTVDIAHHLVLPAAVLSLQFAAHQYLVMRAGMVSELGSDYLLMGRAKGLRERRLKYRYAARNALLPVVTLTGLQLSFAVTIMIFVETVFTYPGIGRLIFDSVGFRDYPTLQACFLALSLLVITLNFLADVLYTRIDPRTTG
jgi:peptide/nickel transport system permease protein